MMADTRFGDVLLNLRNTGIDAMRSYYANSYNAVQERDRHDHISQFKTMYGRKKEELDGNGKYGCGYSAAHVKDARCNSSPYFVNGGAPYRPSDAKSSRKDQTSFSPNQRLADVPLSPISPRRVNHPQSCDSTPVSYMPNHPYNRPTTPPRPSMPEHSVSSRAYLEARYKHSQYKNSSDNYQNNKGHFSYHHHHLDDQVRDMHYDKYHEAYATPCSLPCCYNAKVDDGKRLYECRRDTTPPIPSPTAMKSMDYHGRNDAGESSAFSPIRPAHVRRIQSTESRYLGESTLSHSSGESVKDGDLCSKPCCAGKRQSPAKLHELVPGSHRHPPTNKMNTNVTHDVHYSNRTHEQGHLRYSGGEHHFCKTERNDQAYYVEKEKDRLESRSEMNLNEDFRQRRISGSHYHENVKELFGEYRPIPREPYQHHEESCDENNRLKNDIAHWTPADVDQRIDGRASAAKPTEDGDDGSRTAMKAFDAHIRKMIANSHDANSINYLRKFHNSIHDTSLPMNHVTGVRRSLSLSSDLCDTRSSPHNPNENRRCLSTSSEPLLDTRVSPHSENKHSVTQILGEKDPSPEQMIDQVKLEGKQSECGLREEDGRKDQLQQGGSFEMNIKEEEIEVLQICDSTESTGRDTKVVEDEKENQAVLSGPANKKTEENLEPDTTVPSPEVQCPAVDSTLSDDAVGSPKQQTGGLLGLTRVANEHLGQALAKEKKRSKNNNCLHLWQFLRRMLDQEQDKVGRCIEWTNREIGEFRLIKTAVIAELWGQSKNRTCMTYEKMARAMRYYYKMNILEKVPHKRLHFRFGERILAKVLHPSASKIYIGKPKSYDDIYRMNERPMNTHFPTPLMNHSESLIKDYRNGQHLNYLQLQMERSKETRGPYHPSNMSPPLPPYYNEHVQNHLRNNRHPHNNPTPLPAIVPPLELIPQKTEPGIFPNTIPGKSTQNSVGSTSFHSVDTSLGSNPSVSPYSGEETPDTLSDVDIDSNDDLIVDTDTE